jgi:adenosylcobyric acid synthase
MKGTYDLLSPDEQNRVCGFIINKFRGDIDLLTPGLEQFENLVGKPILGVLPYARDLMVDEEDAIPQQCYPALNTHDRILDVAVIWLPRISNFTDVSPLAADPNVSLRYVSHRQFIGNPDLIILPGSKNSLDDLQHLKDHGLGKEIQRCSDEGSIVLGICAGFQFLGKVICDPLHLESRQAQVEGLGYFDFTTTLQAEKITRQVKVKTSPNIFFPPGLEVTGYEIHMGRTEFHSTPSALFNSNGNPQELGVVHAGGTVLGTPIHGFLDNDPLREALLDRVRSLRDIPKPERSFDYQAFREQQLDRLSDLVRDNLDMNRISDIVFANSRAVKR